MTINDNIKNNLERLNQNIILNLLKDKKEEDLKSLLLDLNKLDFNELEKLINIIKNKKESIDVSESKIEKINYIDEYTLSNEEKSNMLSICENELKNDSYALITMAGGQGTRLGHKGPKGTFKLNLFGEEISIFNIIANKIKEKNEKYNINIPWYIMTSEENNDETVKYFEDNNYFGLNKNDVVFFTQTSQPMILEDGNIVLNEDYSIKYASDGNGSIYKVLKDKKILDDMDNRNIKYTLISSVDNILINVLDEIFLGLFINSGLKMASKTVKKISPEERVGVFCKIDGKPSVIEYSELSEELRYQTEPDGELTYKDAHLMINLFTVDALKEIANTDLEYHLAHKKSDFINSNEEFEIAEIENSYKFEKFIFDSFKYLDDILIVQGKRENDFAPVKNKEGNDSPASAKELYENYYNNI